VDFHRFEPTERIRELIRDAVRAAADEGNVVIVAHAASYALEGRGDVLRVLVTAPTETRVERLSADGRAAKTLEESDKAREQYLKRFYGVSRELPTHDDLVVNTERLTPERAVDAVVRRSRLTFHRGASHGDRRAPPRRARGRGARLRPARGVKRLGWAAVEPTTRFDDLSLDELRTRRSVKWRRYPDDVLPAWVAELDFPLAAPVHRALADALARDDTGYANADGLPAAFASFAAARWRWDVDPQRMLLVADIMSGVGELLRALTAPGDGVVVNPPVYPPFFKMVKEVGRELVEAPLGAGWRLDLDALEAAFATGARCYLLCSPHNPTGTVHTRDELAAIVELAERHDVLVISDEVHAPMTLPGATTSRTSRWGRRTASRSSARARPGTSRGSSARSRSSPRSA
jgi:DNA-binding transcriptional MocR family regulator